MGWMPAGARETQVEGHYHFSSTPRLRLPRLPELASQRAIDFFLLQTRPGLIGGDKDGWLARGAGGGAQTKPANWALGFSLPPTGGPCHRSLRRWGQAASFLLLLPSPNKSRGGVNPEAPPEPVKPCQPHGKLDTAESRSE